MRLKPEGIDKQWLSAIGKTTLYQEAQHTETVATKYMSYSLGLESRFIHVKCD